LNKLNPATVCFSIGQTTAEAVKHFTSNNVIISNNPSPEEILTTAQQYFCNPTKKDERIKE
jgi:uroporphyrinogen-III synthase